MSEQIELANFNEKSLDDSWLELECSGESTNKDLCKHCLTQHIGCYDVELISNGAFGVVFKCRSHENAKLRIPVDQAACKVYYFAKNMRDFELSLNKRSFMNDIESLKEIRHPNILRAYSCFTVYENVETHSPKIVYNYMKSLNDIGPFQIRFCGIFMELLDGSLRDIVDDALPGILSETTRKQIFQQIGNALVYIHKRHYICHNDIKEDNIGIEMPVSNQQAKVNFKLIDFGNAMVNTREEYDQYRQNKGKFGHNPFVSESYGFAKFISALAAPGGTHSESPPSKVYEDPTFQEVLNKLACLNPCSGNYTLNEALKRLD